MAPQKKICRFFTGFCRFFTDFIKATYAHKLFSNSPPSALQNNTKNVQIGQVEKKLWVLENFGKKKTKGGTLGKIFGKNFFLQIKISLTGFNSPLNADSEYATCFTVNDIWTDLWTIEISKKSDFLPIFNSFSRISREPVNRFTSSIYQFVCTQILYKNAIDHKP